LTQPKVDPRTQVGPIPEFGAGASDARASVNKGQFMIGYRIEVNPSAGPRLCGKNGTVIGPGYHPKSLRVILDGSKTPITLHVTYVAIVNA
jgi:hypothetical protein